MLSLFKKKVLRAVFGPVYVDGIWGIRARCLQIKLSCLCVGVCGVTGLASYGPGEFSSGPKSLRASGAIQRRTLTSCEEGLQPTWRHKPELALAGEAFCLKPKSGKDTLYRPAPNSFLGIIGTGRYKGCRGIFFISLGGFGSKTGYSRSNSATVRPLGN